MPKREDKLDDDKKPVKTPDPLAADKPRPSDPPPGPTGDDGDQ